MCGDEGVQEDQPQRADQRRVIMVFVRDREPPIDREPEKCARRGTPWQQASHPVSHQLATTQLRVLSVLKAAFAMGKPGELALVLMAGLPVSALVLWAAVVVG